MQPDDYFPESYWKDWAAFKAAGGSSGCGMSFHPMFECDAEKRYLDLSSFLSCVYAFNLVAEVLGQRSNVWSGDDYPEIRPCGHAHGGLVAARDLLRLAEDRGNRCDQKEIVLDQGHLRRFLDLIVDRYSSRTGSVKATLVAAVSAAHASALERR